MRLFFSPSQLTHAPTQFMVAGRLVAPVEVPERAQLMADALGKLGLTVEQPGDAGLAPITAVHAEHYVQFLATAHERFSKLPNAGSEVLPNVHPHVSAGPSLGPRPKPRTTSVVGEAGWYLGDLAVAIGPVTWSAAYASAQSAIAAADAVIAGDGEATALCRPPGHHAYADRASGFCFLNNAAIAAERLRSKYGRVAIVDFDTHHGDGTQAIFYRRNDVLFASVHTDPAAYYPFYAGYDDERGAGAGTGFNVNLPLPQGSGDAVFIEANRTLADAVDAYGAEALVISAGWDAHKDDPLSKLAVTTKAFEAIGTLWGKMRLPTVVVQEGGYSLAAIQEIAPAFVAAFLAAR
jgi:acetoin utilization deacetylase AcuC-like enzyme